MLAYKLVLATDPSSDSRDPFLQPDHRAPLHAAQPTPPDTPISMCPALPIPARRCEYGGVQINA